ncbi:MAG: MASE1 domain-containing protein [Acidobacteria bacterium]|nr:MASE1 domain-containing protein [Acidobacteriota bacterium]
MTGDARRLIGIGVAVAVAYVIAARLGFQFAFVAEQVTTVWAPTGIAQAALLLWGRSLWPAVWIGAFVANAGTDAPLWTAAGIATGNTLEAVAAAWILRRLPHFDPTLRRIRHVVEFVVVAAVISTTISATIGVATLCAAAVQPWTRFTELWTAWWLGDALGALVVAPVILTIARAPAGWSRRERAETGLLVAGSAVATQIVFGQIFGPTVGHHPLEYVIFPFVIAAAVRPGQPAAALVVLVASGVTIWNTVGGAGPFASSEVHQSLILLPVFMGMLAGTGLLLAAAIAERETGERRRTATYAVGEVLANAPNVTQAAPALLQAIGENLEWQFAALWLVDHDAQRLRCLTVWSDGAPATTSFAAATKDMLFSSGVGLPGRVWATGKVAWIENVVHDSNFPRAVLAREAGIHGAFAFPICLEGNVLGVIEFFNRTILTPDTDLLQTMSTVGNQVGQLMGRKNVESAVVEGQRGTRAILDTALDAIILMNHRGTITEFNPAAERTFGYRREDVLGRELAELLIPRELREQHREGLARYLATGTGPFIDRRIETTGHHADGHEFPVEVSITRVSDDDPPRFTGFVRDLTARVTAEREREQLLQGELSARREAEAANRAKDEFLATLSHELRTPLNAIVGWTRMLLDGTMDERSTRRALQVIDRNAHLQVQLVGDILDVSRIITGGLRLDLQPVDLGSIIGAALDAVRPAANAKKLRLRSRLMASARLTEGDPQRLQQVVWNLLANAVKFTQVGGHVEVELVDAGDGGVRIRVQDDGAGIEPAFLPHVFERFRQADGSVSREHGGLGLGLAIVRHLVELHGGTVRAESPGPGKGSAFTVELPRMDADRALTSSDEQQQAGSRDGSERNQTATLEGCRALVVDDNEDARELIATILTTAGAHVQTASSVSEALRHFEASPPDVLLADIGMPGADGYALIREIRRREAHSGLHLSAAAITAYAANPDRERALAAGFDRHVAKPIRPAAIVEAVLSMRGGADKAS